MAITHAESLKNAMMQTGPICHIKTATLFEPHMDAKSINNIPVDLQSLDVLVTDNSYILYKTNTPSEYFEDDTIYIFDLETKTIKNLYIPIDNVVSYAKIYKDMVFVPTCENNIEVYCLSTGKLIKLLRTELTYTVAFLINEIYIFNPTPETMFVLARNYKYNEIWNFNTKALIPYPKELLRSIWRIYIDNVSSKVYIYSDYKIIVFTDLTFQNYTIIDEHSKPTYYDIYPYRLGKYIYIKHYKIDADTYELIDNPNYYGSYREPYFTKQYIIFCSDRTITFTDYNLEIIGHIDICDESCVIEQVYVLGYKVFCPLDDGTIKTCPIYCTKQQATDMSQYLDDCNVLPPELNACVMSYVGVNTK